MLSWPAAGRAITGGPPQGGRSQAGRMAQRLLNKVAVVTGASGVFGRAVVQRFLAEGAKVVLFARNRGRLEELVERAPARVLIVEGDVTRSPDLDGLAQTTVHRFGGPDVLFVAAEQALPASLQTSTPELLAEIFAVNFHGALQTVRAFDRHLNAGASIAFLTTPTRETSQPGLGGFAASKAALASMARSLALELAPRGIRVNCVAPAFRPTVRATHAIATGGDETIAKADRVAKLSARLFEQVADAALFLASDEAAGIAGQELIVGSESEER